MTSLYYEKDPNKVTRLILKHPKSICKAYVFLADKQLLKMKNLDALHTKDLGVLSRTGLIDNHLNRLKKVRITRTFEGIVLVSAGGKKQQQEKQQQEKQQQEMVLKLMKQQIEKFLHHYKSKGREISLVVAGV